MDTENPNCTPVLSDSDEDEQQLDEWFKQEQQKDLDAACERWGFDFRKDRPVPDHPRWQWVKIDEEVSDNK